MNRSFYSMIEPKHVPYEQARDGNRAFWDELTPVHLRSYGVERFLAGERWLPQEILDEVGDVTGLILAAPAMPFWAGQPGLGAPGCQVTGVDFSPRPLKLPVSFQNRPTCRPHLSVQISMTCRTTLDGSLISFSPQLACCAG
jgi:hypothetical protein